MKHCSGMRLPQYTVTSGDSDLPASQEAGVDIFAI